MELEGTLVLGAGDLVAGSVTAGVVVGEFVCRGTRVLDKIISGKGVD
jgi:hypothetical protein